MSSSKTCMLCFLVAVFSATYTTTNGATCDSSTALCISSDSSITQPCTCAAGKDCYTPIGKSGWGTCKAPTDLRYCDPNNKFQQCLDATGPLCLCEYGKVCYTPPGHTDWGMCVKTDCYFEHKAAEVPTLIKGGATGVARMDHMWSGTCPTVDFCKRVCSDTAGCNYFMREPNTGEAHLYKIAFYDFKPKPDSLAWSTDTSDSYFCNAASGLPVLPEPFTAQQKLDTLFWASLDKCYNHGPCPELAPMASFCMTTAVGFIGKETMCCDQLLVSFSKDCAVDHSQGSRKRRETILSRKRRQDYCYTSCDDFYDINNQKIDRSMGMCGLAYNCHGQAVLPDPPRGCIQEASKPNCCTQSMYHYIRVYNEVY